MADFTGVSVVIPTIDEWEDIENVITRVLQSNEEGDVKEIILVYCEKSEKAYIDFLRQLAEKYASVKLYHQKNRGVSAAVYESFSIAQGSHLVAIGADMENDPNDIAEMVKKAKLHPNSIITASRRLRKGDFSEYPPIKRLCNIIFQEVLHLLFKTKQSDITYLYQLTPASIMQMQNLDENRDVFVLALALLTEINNYPFEEIPSKVGIRKNGKSHNGLGYYLGFIKAVCAILRKRAAGI